MASQWLRGGLIGSLIAAAAAAPAASSEVMDVETLRDDIEQHVGQSVTVRGEVSDSLDGSAFTLEGGGVVNDEIAVIMPGAGQGAAAGFAENSTVTVSGTVRQVAVIELERELGWDLNPQIEAELEDVRYFIIADEVMSERDGPSSGLAATDAQ